MVHGAQSFLLFVLAAITLNYSRLLTEVSEGAGTVEFLRITKQGETELTKEITFSESELTCSYIIIITLVR